MKKFRFSLERVRRVRKIQETLRLSEQKRAERALKAQQEKLTMFTNERDVQCVTMEATFKKEFRVADRQTDWKYLERIDRIVGYQSGVVKEYKQHEHAARLKFMEARQKSLGLDKLGDKKREEWQKELISLEQKIADDNPRKSNTIHK
ncbi:MAG: flagellar FliJ family protein [Calditrichaeota bacterium]|nr:flagellar FliJ family protein [Calditrichota bacterium]MCB9368823.1 flagellar FliJ family protein [Calditrichota bacterium]